MSDIKRMIQVIIAMVKDVVNALKKDESEK